MLFRVPNGEHISEDGSTIYVRQSIWRAKEQEPKTQAAIRNVDVPKELASMLATLIGHQEGFLFRTSTGRPLSARNVLRDSLHPTLLALKQPKMGFHCFRRFRESVLQKSEARALLIDYWMGHENQDMGTRYGQQLLKDVEWRKEWAEKIGVGFKLTSLELRIGQPGQLSKSKTQPARAA